MLRSLLGEVMRRHLWPIPAVALIVAVAAPLLFLKSAPTAPAASTSAPAAPPAGQLPARAKRLLATSDAKTSAGRERRRKADPFQARSWGGGAPATADEKSASSDTAKTSTTADPVPVVITNADGTTPAASTRPAPSTTPGSATTPGIAPSPIGDDATKAIPSTATKLVDVRFGERMPAALHRSIPPLQTFVAGGRVVAIFVKYSPARDKAVFAIAPGSLLAGDIDCRRKGGVCRYVDVPAGKAVRLTATTSLGVLVKRRLDVAHIAAPDPGSEAGAAARTSPADGACLLGKLLTRSTGDASLASDACED